MQNICINLHIHLYKNMFINIHIYKYVYMYKTAHDDECERVYSNINIFFTMPQWEKGDEL